MKVLFLFGGKPRRMKAAGTRQKMIIGGKRLWKIQSAIAKMAGYEAVFCTNENTKNGPKNIFPASETIAESITSFLKENKEEFAIIRGDILLNPYKWGQITYSQGNNTKIGCRIVDGALTTLAYNIGNTWSSFWIIKPKDYRIFEGTDWQLLSEICDYRNIDCVEIDKDDFIEIDGYDDLERAECLLKKWGVWDSSGQALFPTIS